MDLDVAENLRLTAEGSGCPGRANSPQSHATRPAWLLLLCLLIVLVVLGYVSRTWWEQHRHTIASHDRVFRIALECVEELLHDAETSCSRTFAEQYLQSAANDLGSIYSEAAIAYRDGIQVLSELLQDLYSQTSTAEFLEETRWDPASSSPDLALIEVHIEGRLRTMTVDLAEWEDLFGSSRFGPTPKGKLKSHILAQLEQTQAVRNH